MEKPLAKGKSKRLATENKIIKAFEKLLKKHGLGKVGVNAIIKEAGVGKGLLYEYFGGLEGLTDAWVEKSHFIPDLEEISGGPVEEFLEKPMHEQIKDVHVNYATSLKNNPLALEIFADELHQSAKLSSSIEHLRLQIGKTHEQFFTELNPVQDPDDVALIFILQAASNYLALKSRTSPNYNGVMLDTDEGWQSLMDMFGRVVDRHAANKPR
jgi:AcrR family transcriptional regulator